MIEVWFDGSCIPQNPGGKMGWGWHLQGKIDGVTETWTREEKGEIEAAPENTNNLAEYIALEEALLYLISRTLTAVPVVIRGDSQLVIRQMFPSGPKHRRWRIKKGAYAPKARECLRLLGRFANIRGEWLPREKNTQADALSKGGKG